MQTERTLAVKISAELFDRLKEYLEKNHLKPGDQITITHHSVSFSVTLDGMAKDALLGSSMMGNSRFLFSKAEIEQLLSDDKA